MSLREDYNDETNNQGKYGDFEHAQDELSKHLRVQIDNGLKLVPAPYVTKKSSKEYTLVLDLDETLLHFEEVSILFLKAINLICFKLQLNDNEGQLSIRPGADSFLKLMNEYFQIVIFTAGTEEYADWALSFLEN